MSESKDLSNLTADTFEHMVNSIALEVLGAGATVFSPGSDGGRNGTSKARRRILAALRGGAAYGTSRLNPISLTCPPIRRSGY